METKRIKIRILISLFCTSLFAYACKPVRITPGAFSDDEYHKFRVLGSLGIADGDTIFRIPGLDFHSPKKIIKDIWHPTDCDIYFLIDKQYLCFVYSPDRTLTSLEIANRIAEFLEANEHENPSYFKPLREAKKRIESASYKGRVNVVLQVSEYNVAFLNIIPENLDGLIEIVTRSIKINSINTGLTAPNKPINYTEHYYSIFQKDGKRSMIGFSQNLP